MRKMSTIDQNARWHFLIFFPNRWELLVQILLAYYTFQSTLKIFYPIISNYDEVMPY